MTDEPDIQQIADDARETFDLGDFLRGRSQRTRSVRVFTDEVIAEQRGGVEPATRILSNGMEVPDIRSWGKVGELAEIQGAYDALESKSTKEARAMKARITEVTDEIRVLTEALLKTALDIELHSVPPEIVKDAKRAAKKHLGIKSKGYDFDDDDQFEEYYAQLFSRTISSITKHGTSSTTPHSVENTRILKGYLPTSEYNKLISQLNELLFQSSIATAAVEEPDFSPGI